MRLLLHHDAGPVLAAMLAELPAGLTAAIVPPGRTDLLGEELATAEVLLHVLAPVDAALIDAAPRLRLIQKLGVGVDAIDLAHARRRGIAVCNMPGTNTAAVAEFTLALMLSCLRRIPALDAAMRVGAGWAEGAGAPERPGEIGGRVVGLVGYGAVSRRLAPVLAALGAEVVVATRGGVADGWPVLALDELLSRADIVSLHLPLAGETRGLLSAGRIGLMRRGSILVNTARGGLVDEAALRAALDSGHLAAAGLDVFGAEPVAAGDPLVAHRSVVATPHVAWATAETMQRCVAVAIENARRLAEGRPLLHRV
jgi:phosphoglycerate dehydrogenase-like enzyme